jgi:hypothetical protein
LPAAPLVGGVSLAVVIFLLSQSLKFYWLSGLYVLGVGLVIALVSPRGRSSHGDGP